MTYCEFSDLDSTACAHCRNLPGDEPRGEAEAWTDARFDAPCYDCGRHVHVGDRIGLVDGQWVCERCAS